MREQRNLISHSVTWIAAIIALLLACIFPGLVWFTSETSQAHDIELEVAMTAERITSEIIKSSPAGWDNEVQYLQEIVNRGYVIQTGWLNGDSPDEQRSVLDLSGKVIFSSGSEKISWPVMSRSAPLLLAGQEVGTYNIKRTLNPAFKLSVYAAILGVVLGFAAFAILRILPLRALRRTLDSLEREEENLRILVDNAMDAIISTSIYGEIESFNIAAEKIFGFSRDEILNKPISELYISLEISEPEIPTNGLNISKNVESLARRKDGRLFSVEFSCSKILQENTFKYVVILRDISERKKAQENLALLANYDSLTGLPNRNMFRDRLTEAMARAQRNDQLLVLMFLDLDRFKPINDTMGHAVGDELLKAVANRLKNVLRKVDTVVISSPEERENSKGDDATVSRLGGDEFTIILEGVHHINGATTAAQKVLDSFALPFNLSSGAVYISASIGITIFPFDDDDIDNLIKNADTAMYRSKESGSNCFNFYREDMNSDAHDRLTMEFHLRQALERNEFSLHYQPKLEFSSGRIVGVEALLRWNNPVLGSVSPIRFIPILEDNGLILEVGGWVLRTACQQLRSWLDEGMLALTMAVNLSARQFRQAGIVEQIDSILLAANLPATLLEVEITESLLMEHTSSIITVLEELKQRGVGIAIDDFGTGYSSLAYLKRFPLTTLKIDRSFVQDIATNEYDAAIAGAVIALAHGLHLSVVAEGVETEAQMRFLDGCGCHQMQGYLLARPLPPEQFSAWLKARNQG